MEGESFGESSIEPTRTTTTKGLSEQSANGFSIARSIERLDTATKMTATGTVVVVFDPAITEAELRRIVRGAGARIVDGPTQGDGYVLELPAERQAAVLEALRAQRAVVLAEQLRPRGSR